VTFLKVKLLFGVLSGMRYGGKKQASRLLTKIQTIKRGCKKKQHLEGKTATDG